jgi:hypothetical protein
MTFTRAIAVTVFGATLFCIFQLSVTAQETAEFDMQKKLEYSKNILDGLVSEDYDVIRSNAKALNELGKKKWMENESSEYRTQNQVFWFTAGSLALAAEQKNIDGATLAYTQMTVSCINCHKLIRHR